MDNYLEELKGYLAQLSADDRDEATDFYAEYLQDGGFDTYDMAVSELGTPRQLAHKILADNSIRMIDESSPVQTPGKTSRNQIRTIWLIILGILSTPISVPLAIAGFAVLFAVLAVLAAVILAIVAVVITVFVAGITIFGVGVGVLSTSTSTGLVYIGSGLVAVGAFFMFVPVLLWIVQKIIDMTLKFSRWIYGKFSSKRHPAEGRA